MDEDMAALRNESGSPDPDRDYVSRILGTGTGSLVFASGGIVSEPVQWETLDSGQRQVYETGMRRDLQDGKPRFDLIMAKDLPYEEQLLTRWAGLMERGAVKYGIRNWELASTEKELARFRESAMRHMVQYLCGEDDEDHAAAVLFNLNAIELVKWKMRNAEKQSR